MFGNASDAGQGLCNMIKQASATAIQQRGVFTLAVTTPECAMALASLIGGGGGGGGAPAPAAAPAGPRPVSPIRGGRDRKRAMMSGMANVPQPQAAAAPQAPSSGGGGGASGVEFEKWHVLFAAECMNGHPNFTAMRDQFLLQVSRTHSHSHTQLAQSAESRNLNQGRR